MTFVVTSACKDCVYTSCVAVCPCDCFYDAGSGNMLFINPKECIDCGLCEYECPVGAIYYEILVPTEERDMINFARYKSDESNPKVTKMRTPLNTQGRCDPRW